MGLKDLIDNFRDTGEIQKLRRGSPEWSLLCGLIGAVVCATAITITEVFNNDDNNENCTQAVENLTSVDDEPVSNDSELDLDACVYAFENLSKAVSDELCPQLVEWNPRDRLTKEIDLVCQEARQVNEGGTFYENPFQFGVSEETIPQE
jgi:hypothetical protein